MISPFFFPVYLGENRPSGPPETHSPRPWDGGRGRGSASPRPHGAGIHAASRLQRDRDARCGTQIGDAHDPGGEGIGIGGERRGDGNHGKSKKRPLHNYAARPCRSAPPRSLPSPRAGLLLFLLDPQSLLKAPSVNCEPLVEQLWRDAMEPGSFRH